MIDVKKVLCAVDFSEPSLGALCKATEMARHFQAELLVVHVLPLTPPFPAALTSLKMQPDHERVAQAECELTDLLARDMFSGLRVRGAVKWGYPDKEILALAQEEDCDLIVLATHGRTGWRHLLLGSVAEAVVQKALCPVLTVRADLLEAASARKGVASSSPDTSAPNTTPAIDPALEEQFSAQVSSSQKLKFLLNYAVLAPSNRNSQPWLWYVGEDTAELYADMNRAVPVIDPDNRELILSCGGALEHLLIAIRHFGYEGCCEVSPDPGNPDFLASVGLGEKMEAAPEEEQLFKAMPLRRTNRFPFKEREVPASLLELLRLEAALTGAGLFFVKDTEEKLSLINLIVAGDRLQASDPKFVEETMGWMRGNQRSQSDGIPLHNLGEGGLLSRHANDLGEAQAEKDKMLAWSSPALAVMGTCGDLPQDWLAAGRALSRILLRAAGASVQASFFNSPVEMVAMSPLFHHLFGQAGFPQLIFRLGYPTQEAPPTPRRKVEEVTWRPSGKIE